MPPAMDSAAQRSCALQRCSGPPTSARHQLLQSLLTERHQTLASALRRVCNEAGRAAATEVQCIPGSRNVHADLYIYASGADSKPIAVDVQVVSPSAYPSWSGKPGLAVQSGGKRKKKNFAEDVQSAHDKTLASKGLQSDSPHQEKQKPESYVDFIPFSVSSYGLLGQEAREFISLVASWLCQRWIWTVVEAEEHIRRVVLSSVMAFMGSQMLTTLHCS